MTSMVGIMSVEWMTNVRDNESISGSYNLYETVSNKTLYVCKHQFEIRDVSVDAYEMSEQRSGSLTM